VEFGVNSRLDEIQAAILRARLPLLAGWTARRRALAARYRRGLAGAPVTVPPERDSGHVYHLFPIRTARRDALQAHLTSRGIGTLVHYPIPIPKQDAMRGVASGPCPVADQVASDVCSLPLHHNLADEDVDAVVAAIHEWR
jgi:dTDP-3-amino-3,4,6-trideoxy-alpha-D-glucose transaminase